MVVESDGGGLWWTSKHRQVAMRPASGEPHCYIASHAADTLICINC